jgi:hypothetical protein
MARTVAAICFMAFVWPIAVLADSLGPMSPGNYLLTVGGVVPGNERPVSPENDMLAAGVVIPSEESGLLSPLSTEENTAGCLRTSAGSERPNGYLNSTGSGASLEVGAQLEPTTGDLKLFLLTVVLLGGMRRFLTSAYYSALWDRLFSPLNWC